MLSGQPGTVCLNDTWVYVRLAEAECVHSRVALARTVVGGGRAKTLLAARHGRLRGAYFDVLSRSLRRRLAPGRQIGLSTRMRFLDLIADQYTHANEWYDFQTHYAEPLRRAVASLDSPRVDARELVAPILREIASVVAGHEPIRTLGEKTPLHTNLAPWLFSLYPDAKAVLLVRDPITNVASIHKRGVPLPKAIRLYDRFVPSILWLFHHPQVHSLAYRSLLQRPKDSMESAARFLHLPDFDPTIPVKPFGKEKYTGTQVDSGREPAPESVLDSATRDHLRRRNRAVYEVLERLTARPA